MLFCFETNFKSIKIHIYYVYMNLIHFEIENLEEKPKELKKNSNHGRNVKPIHEYAFQGCAILQKSKNNSIF